MNNPLAGEITADLQQTPDRRSGSARHAASAWLPVVFCIMVIATESTPYFGADRTSNPLRHFVEYFWGPLTGPQWWRTHIIIRKCGHFLGYGFLSIAWFRAFWMTFRPLETIFRRRVSAHLLAMLGTLLVASSDEIHQLFLPNRTGSARDVLVDCCGGAVMQMVVWMWMRGRFLR